MGTTMPMRLAATTTTTGTPAATTERLNPLVKDLTVTEVRFFREIFFCKFILQFEFFINNKNKFKKFYLIRWILDGIKIDDSGALPSGSSLVGGGGVLRRGGGRTAQQPNGSISFNTPDKEKRKRMKALDRKKVQLK